MQLIDTHTHIYLDQFSKDLETVLQSAQASGITDLYLPGIDSSVIGQMMRIEASYPECCHLMMGLHPCSVKEDYKQELAVVENWLQQRSFCAVGETGLDFHWDTTFQKEQYEAFDRQVSWAKEYEIPVVIHSRKSMDDCISFIQERQDGSLKGVFHCFSGTVEQARQIIDLGFLLGIGGVVTYKNGGLDPVVQAIGLSHIVLETDAPYLAPVPFRGKRNEPSYLIEVAKKLAALTGLVLDDVASITTRNARQLFS